MVLTNHQNRNEEKREQDMDSICLCVHHCVSGCAVNRISKSLGLKEKAGIFYNTPGTLFYQALNKLLVYLECSVNVELKPQEELLLPSKIGDALFELFMHKKGVLDSNFFKLIKNTRLTRIYLWAATKIENKDDFFILLNEQLTVLDLTGSKYTINLPDNILFYVNEFCINLEVLALDSYGRRNVFSKIIDDNISTSEERPYVLKTPKLKCLILKNFFSYHKILPKLLPPLKNLTYLDLSYCIDHGYLEYLVDLPQLSSLILHGIILRSDDWKQIEKLNKLQFLDVSFPRENVLDFYDKPNEILKSLMEHLPKLVSLDISGTNLDGPDKENEGSIVGLKSRTDHPLKYIGLYRTFHNACKRTSIPAENVSGSDNLLQLFNAAFAHSDRPIVINMIFKDLQKLNIELNDIHHVLELVFSFLDRHLDGEIHEFGLELVDHLLKKVCLPLPIKINVMNRIFGMNYSRIRPGTYGFKIFPNACGILKRYLKTAEDINLVFSPLLDFLIRIIPKMDEVEIVSIMDFLLHFLGIIDTCQTDLFLDEKIIKVVTKSWHYGCLFTNYGSVCRIQWDLFKLLFSKSQFFCRIFLETVGIDLFLESVQEHPKDNGVLSSATDAISILAEHELFLVYLMNEEFIASLTKLLSRQLEPKVISNSGYMLAKLLSYPSESWANKNPSRKKVAKKMNRHFKNWMTGKITFRI